jgi:hypothetical protein
MKKLLLTLLVLSNLLFLPGKDKPPAVIRLPITAASWKAVTVELFGQTEVNMLSPDMPTDELYWLPTYEQLTALDKAVRPKLHLEYIDNARDCNHMAFEFYVLSHEWAIEKVTHGAPISLAVFICYVKIHPEAFDGRFGGEGLHALALILAADGVAWFYDVQSGRHVKVVEAVIEGSIEPYKIIF